MSIHTYIFEISIYIKDNDITLTVRTAEYIVCIFRVITNLHSPMMDSIMRKEMTFKKCHFCLEQKHHFCLDMVFQITISQQMQYAVVQAHLDRIVYVEWGIQFKTNLTALPKV